LTIDMRKFTRHNDWTATWLYYY